MENDLCGRENTILAMFIDNGKRVLEGLEKWVRCSFGDGYETKPYFLFYFFHWLNVSMVGFNISFFYVLEILNTLEMFQDWEF